MTNDTRRRSREQSDSSESVHQKMDGNYYCPSSAFLVQKFSLNSFDRIVARKGVGRKPDNHFTQSSSKKQDKLIQILSGRKCSDYDLSLLQDTFDRYRKAVNLVLEKVYSDKPYAEALGHRLENHHGQGYVLLRGEAWLKWEKDNEFGRLLYERL